MEDENYVDSTGEEHSIGEENEGDISTEILIVVFLLMLASIAGQFLKKSGHKYLQESGLTVIIGMVAGFAFKMMNVSFYLSSLTAHFSGIFVILLLPPIIFESGYNMNKKYFMKNAGSILMYSFLGTFIAVFSTSLMVWAFGEIGLS
jgi:NhaP-type Na+/H+ or K+/H+ antiporter